MASAHQKQGLLVAGGGGAGWCAELGKKKTARSCSIRQGNNFRELEDANSGWSDQDPTPMQWFCS